MEIVQLFKRPSSMAKGYFYRLFYIIWNLDSAIGNLVKFIIKWMLPSCSNGIQDCRNVTYFL